MPHGAKRQIADQLATSVAFANCDRKDLDALVDDGAELRALLRLAAVDQLQVSARWLQGK